MNKNTFDKYLKELLSLGYVKVTQSRKSGKMYKNIYTIAMDKRDIEPNKKVYAQIAINNKHKRPSKQVNNLPSQCLKNCDIDVPCHKKQDTEFCDSNINSLKSNRVVVDDAFATNENKTIELYKTFKLEKRVTPHMINLLKQYANKFDIEIFEDIFVNTSEKKPDSNFRYIRHILETLDRKGIFTIAQYKLDYENYKVSKNNKAKTKSSSVKKIEKVNEAVETKNTYKKTAFHNFNETFTQYAPDELDEIIEKSQKEKFGNENEHKKRAHA